MLFRSQGAAPIKFGDFGIILAAKEIDPVGDSKACRRLPQCWTLRAGAGDPEPVSRIVRRNSGKSFDQPVKAFPFDQSADTEDIRVVALSGEKAREIDPRGNETDAISRYSEVRDEAFAREARDGYHDVACPQGRPAQPGQPVVGDLDRKSTRLNSSH